MRQSSPVRVAAALPESAAVRSRRSFRAPVLAALWAAVIAGVAFATPFTDSLTALDASVDARVAALPATGGTRAERNERKQLVRASTALGRVQGLDLAADAPAVAAAAKALRASRTADAGVLTSSEAALAELLTELRARQTEAADAVLRVQDPVARAKAAKLLDAAAKLVQRAADAATVDAASALKLLATAIVRVDSAAAKVSSLPAFSDPPTGILPYRPGGRGDFYIINQSGATVTIDEIAYDVIGTFYDGSTATLRLTQEQVLAKFFASLPQAELLTNDTYDCSGPLLVTLFTRMEKQRRSDFAGFTGRAVVRIAGHEPFVVSVSGR